MKICLIVGTRPEIIKISPLVTLLEKECIDFFIIHSNQHYSPEMDEVFFNELNLPRPKYNLNVGSGKHSNQTGNILIKIEPVLEEEAPDYVLVQGDTNTVLAGAMAAAKLDIKVGHIEAGLRSYDRKMPEETNRVVTDHLSSFLFAVTSKQQGILTNESISPEKIHIVGNTIVDAVYANLEIAKDKSTILSENNLASQEYVLFTAHRSSNVDDKNALVELTDCIAEIAKDYKVVWPIHPRAQKQVENFEIKLHENITTIPPTGYLDFLMLQKNAKVVLTDSGGLQEESCILGTPCITLRENTERPETIDVGANVLVGRNKAKLLKYFQEAISRENSSWENPFGDGTTSNKILQIVNEDFYGARTKKINTSNVCVIGLGYMGLPMACLLANSGNKVTGVDINPEKIKLIQENISPFDEDGMPELLTKALNTEFTAQTSPVKADTFLISVPTPHKDKKCDLTYVYSAIDSVLDFVEDDNLIIIESTIKPNTCREVDQYIKSKTKKNILLAHCPERAIPGNTVTELIINDRIIGGVTPQATDKAYKLYASFSKGTLFKTDATTAECCKLIENTYRDVNIALANEIDIILKDLEVNTSEAIALANKHPRVNVLSPGPGVGGHCISIDPWFLIENTDKAELIPIARKINDERPHYWVNLIDKYCRANNITKIGLLGLAYKKDVDDTRETHSKDVYEGLINNGYEVKVNDPHVPHWITELDSLNDIQDWAELLVITTNHSLYEKALSSNKTRVINTHG